MKDSLKKLSLLLLLCGAPLSGFAEDDDDEYEPPLEYAYNNTFEFFWGWSANASWYPGLMDKGLGCFGKGIGDGMNFQARFTRFGFEDRHWGWYVQFALSPIWGDEYTLAIRAADECGWKGLDYTIQNDYYCFEREGGGSVYGQAIVGAVYRYDFAKHWSLRPRVGIGYRSMNSYGGDVTIYRTLSTDRAEMYDYHFDLCDRHGRDLDSRLRRLAFNTSVQLQFTLRRHFYFSAEVGLSGTFGHLYQRTTRNHWIYSRDPEYGYLYLGDVVEAFPTETRINRVSHMGQFVDFSIGVGWNVGRNQNDRNRKRR